MFARVRFYSMLIIGSLCAVMFVTLTGPAHSQDSDGFQETFHSAQPTHWGLYQNSSVSDGVLHVQDDGTSGREGRWDNQTLTLRMRLPNGGAVAIHYRHNQDQSYMVVVGNDYVRVQRRMEGGQPSPEIGMADSIVVPQNRWFELSITSLGNAHVVGIDGEHVLTAIDPEGELPPGGIVFHAWGETQLEVDEVTLTPWFVEDFEGPLGSGWGEARVANGALQLPPQTWVAYGGHTWGDMTYIIQVRQPGQGSSGFSYHLRGQTTYMVGLGNNTVNVRREQNGAGGDLASAAVTNAPSDEWRWLSVTVNGAQHTVQVDSTVVLTVTDPNPLPSGGIALESADTAIEVGWIAVGPPLPLPTAAPAGLQQPSVQPAQPAAPMPQPPAGVCSVSSTQNVNIRSGPDTTYGVIGTLYPGTYLTVDGHSGSGWWHVVYGSGQSWVSGNAVQTHGNCSNVSQVSGPAQPTQPPAQPQPTEPPPPPGGGEWGILRTDIAVTDVFVDSMPYGTVHFRLTNHGPGTLSNVGILVGCSTTMTELATGAQLTRSAAPSSYTVNLAPGQTQTFKSHLDLDTKLYSHNFTCTAQPDFNDPNSGNNSLSEFVTGGADLALGTNYACGQPPQLMVSVTNNGPLQLPDTWTVACTVTANCYGGFTGCNEFPAGMSSNSMPMVGRSSGYSLGVGADFGQYESFSVTCNLGSTFDPNPANNTWTDTISIVDCIRSGQ
jgi:hypothetical protein